jgi:uncharacterized zinc-type alcohol dehydrogenase-like protein
MDPYLGYLNHATMVLVGSRLKPFHGGNIIMGRKSSIGSLIENQRNTRDVRL